MRAEPAHLLHADHDLLPEVGLVEDDRHGHVPRHGREIADPVHQGVQAVDPSEVADREAAVGPVEHRIPEILPHRVFAHEVEEGDLNLHELPAGRDLDVDGVEVRAQGPRLV